MTEETEIVGKQAEGGLPVTSADSSVFGVSVRAWLATVLVATICANHLMTTVSAIIEAVATKNFDRIGTLTTVGEPLYSMSVAALGFYFGQKQTAK